MHGYKKLLLTALLAIFLIPLKGQNTDSPYSRYGYGILNNQSIGVSKTMGGVSYGLRGLSTNPGNPASYSSVDSLTFIFDMGISYKNARLSEGNTAKNYSNGGLDYIAVQFPLAKRVGMSLGLLPFTSVGYSFGETDSKDVTNTRSYSGEGGLSQVYGGLAYRPLDNLSIGANVSYIFGNTSYTRGLTFPGNPGATSQSLYHKLVINMLRFDIGAQYSLDLNKRDNVTIGVVFSPKVKTTGSITKMEYSISSTGTTIQADTTSYNGDEVPTDLPYKFGAGFMWKRNSNLFVGFDATYETWSKARYSAEMEDGLTKSSNRFNDTWRFNAGLEYTIDPRSRSVMKRIKFRGGVSYNNSYINVSDSQGKTSGYKEYGATIGFGIPIRDTYTNRSSYINIGFEYKNLAPANSNLIKEQYFGISLGVCLNDLWFLQNKLR